MNIDVPVVALCVGGWGAILSTILGIFTIRRELRDRAQVKVFPIVSVILNGPQAGKSILAIHITNLGRRPANIQTVACKTSARPGKTCIWNAVGLPKMLEKEGENTTLTVDVPEDVAKVTKLWVVDSHGRQWYANKKAIRQLRSDGADKNK